MSEPIRLSKRLIELVGCSRREAELFIEGGWVTVDGEVIDEPQFKVDQQKVELDPQAKATAPEPVTLLLNAPAGLDTDSAMQLLSPQTLSEEHRFGKRPLKGHFLRLSVGNELQANASGLLVFTQDWKIVRKLTADASKIEQEYVVEVSGEMAPPRPDLQRSRAACGQSQLAE
jgi:23S rRNA pseudouridine2604 synthase